MVGTIITLPCHSSTSKHLEIAKSFLGYNLEVGKDNVIFEFLYPDGLEDCKNSTY